MQKCLLYLPVVLLLAACSAKSVDNDGADEAPTTVIPSKIAEVTVMKLEPSTFNHEIVSNGKVSAHDYADLYFRTPELISEIYVKNGDRVRKGQKIAQLDLFKLNNTLAQNRNSLSQATLEMQDVLIGQGYDPEKADAVPAEVMKLAKVRSGYDQSEAAYQSTLKDIEMATLVAPFDGVVANLFEKRHNMAKSSDPFCRVINDATMDVEFSVLEGEVAMIKPGDAVEVNAFSAAESQPGRVAEINPIVDKDGMVRVKATVNGGRGLLDGQNVRVSVKRSLGTQLVIPKSALVLRSGKQVVFSHQDGKAMWNYVTIGLENLEHYTVTDGLQEGMEIITSGNVNLAHEAPVKVIAQ